MVNFIPAPSRTRLPPALGLAVPLVVPLALLALLAVGCSSSPSQGSPKPDASAPPDEVEASAPSDAACSNVTDALGVWTDPSTCLMWQDPLFDGLRDWSEATAACDTLVLGGYDDWRLPTLDELRSLARGCPATVTGGACGVTSRCLDTTCWTEVCQGCSEFGGPSSEGCYRLSNLNGDCMTSWTSEAVPDQPTEVWTVGFGGCHVLRYPKTMAINTRCVR